MDSQSFLVRNTSALAVSWSLSSFDPIASPVLASVAPPVAKSSSKSGTTTAASASVSASASASASASVSSVGSVGSLLSADFPVSTIFADANGLSLHELYFEPARGVLAPNAYVSNDE